MLRTKDDHARRSITTFLILCPTQLNHVLRSRVCNVYLSQNRVSIVRQSEKRV